MKTATDYMKTIGNSELSRDDYERICTDLGLNCFSDEEILKKEYAMLYGDFWMSHYSAEQTATMEAAKLRYRSIILNKNAGVEISQPSSTKTKICACGHEVNENAVLMTSFGSSCQDCYDDMSDR